MARNSCCVPRRAVRNSGMSPMPSGRRRITSSVTPGRMVGLIMPTTPRQLEKVIGLAFVILAARHVSLGDIAGKGGAIAFTRIAVAAATGALQQEALARLHLVPSRMTKRAGAPALPPSRPPAGKRLLS